MMKILLNVVRYVQHDMMIFYGPSLLCGKGKDPILERIHRHTALSDAFTQTRLSHSHPNLPRKRVRDFFPFQSHFEEQGKGLDGEAVGFELGA